MRRIFIVVGVLVLLIVCKSSPKAQPKGERVSITGEVVVTVTGTLVKAGGVQMIYVDTVK